MTELETRNVELLFREESAEDGFVEGIAVPYNSEANIGAYKERFERGAFTGSDDIKLYRDHKELIGHVVESEDREDGFWIKAKVALTTLGKDTLELLRSGALSKFSVGFVPVTNRDDNGVVVRTKATLREVSVVERPAYSGAHVLSVRQDESGSDPAATKGGIVPDTDAISAEQLTEVRTAIEGSIEELSRRFDTFEPVIKSEPKIETRSAGEILKAIANRDADTIAHYEEVQTRSYTGGTSADSPINDAWVGDLTSIFDASSGVLAAIFSTGPLPETGMSLEYAQRLPASNTVAVAAQSSEGADLGFGKITLATETADVKTYGGATQLTLQEIKRSTLPILNRTLEALAVAAGVNKKAVLRTDFNTLVAAQVTAENVVTAGHKLSAITATDLTNLIIDAAIAYEAKNAQFDALVVSTDVFKAISVLTVSGNRVFTVSAHDNAIGQLNLPGLVGDINGVTVVCDTGLTTRSANFVNGNAIRQYDSGVVSLSDSNIVNLSNTYSVYRFGAVADEIPDFVVPVVIPAES